MRPVLSRVPDSFDADLFNPSIKEDNHDKIQPIWTHHTCLGHQLYCSGSRKPRHRCKWCAGDADIDDTTFIVWEFEDSVHEMITCGNLTFVLIRRCLIWWMQTGDAKLPEAARMKMGLMVTGDGVTMDMSFTRGANTPEYRVLASNTISLRLTTTSKMPKSLIG